MEMKPFDKLDWEAYCGCESAPGKEPMIGVNHRADGMIVSVVADINGANVIFTDEDGELLGDYIIICSYEQALELAAGLSDDFDSNHLIDIGFYRNH